MKVQMTRHDWENSGMYEDHAHCPGATMMTRIMGRPMFSMSWTRYEDDGTTSISLVHNFNVSAYRKAEKRYKNGEEILFESETV